MARSRITINGLTSSYYEAGVGDTVQLTNDGEGDEVSVLWVAATGSQPSGSYDGFSDPLSSSPTITVRKEGNYLIRNLVDSTLTGSAVISVRHQKSNLESPAAGEKSEKNEEFGWARAVQNLASAVDDLYADGGTIVGLARENMKRGDLVRPSGSLLVKSGLPGEERVMEFARISGEHTGSFQTTLYIVEGIGPSGSQENPTSGSLFKARLYGLFGPVTGTFSGSIKGSTVFPRSDGILSLNVDSVDRKIGTVIDHDASSYYVHFDGTSDWRLSSTGSVAGGSSAIDVQSAGSTSATSVSVLNFSGSGISFSISESPEGTALIVASGSSQSGGSSSIDVQKTGSLISSGVTTLNFTGSGVHVADAGSGVAEINIPQAGLYLLDRIYVTSSTNIVKFGPDGDGQYKTEINGDNANLFEIVFYVKRQTSELSTDASDYMLMLSESMNTSAIKGQRHVVFGTNETNAEWDGKMALAYSDNNHISGKGHLTCRTGFAKMLQSNVMTYKESLGAHAKHTYTSVYYDLTSSISYMAISGSVASGSFFELYRRAMI